MRTATLLSTAALAFAPALFAETYAIDPAHSSAAFSVKHMMLSNVKGQFRKVNGTVQFDPANPAATRIDANIDAASITTGDDQRDTHLKSADFFDTAKFPQITFRGKSVARAADGRYAVKGDLTMHGVTEEVTLDVDGPTPEQKDPWGLYRVGAAATTKVNRKDFGLTWNKALEAGGIMVGEDVAITLDLEFTRKPGATKPSQP